MVLQGRSGTWGFGESDSFISHFERGRNVFVRAPAFFELEPKMNKDQNQAWGKILERVERITHADAKFFKRFPHRKFRVRPAGRAEFEEMEILANAAPVPKGFRLEATICQLEPGIRLRAYTVGFEKNDTDPGENGARFAFEYAVGNGIGPILSADPPPPGDTGAFHARVKQWATEVGIALTKRDRFVDHLLAACGRVPS
jgi:hypothetical protein